MRRCGVLCLVVEAAVQGWDLDPEAQVTPGVLSDREIPAVHNPEVPTTQM